MKTLHLTDEELDAIKCALRLAISTPGDFTLRADMFAALKKVEKKPLCGMPDFVPNYADTFRDDL